jgi:microcystin-dependent protein
MGLVVLPKSLIAHTDAVAADVMADLNAIVAQVNGGIASENLASVLRQALAEPGDIKASGRSAAPSGWLMCEGQAVSRATFSALFAAIGTAYGAGDGATTFNVPDLRGRVPVGVDGTAGRLSANDARGQSAGHESLQAHTHGGSSLTMGGESATHFHSFVGFNDIRHDGTGVAYNVINPAAGIISTAGESSSHTHAMGGNTDSTGGGNGQNLQPYQVVNYMVKT